MTLWGRSLPLNKLENDPGQSVVLLEETGCGHRSGPSQIAICKTLDSAPGQGHCLSLNGHQGSQVGPATAADIGRGSDGGPADGAVVHGL